MGGERGVSSLWCKVEDEERGEGVTGRGREKKGQRGGDCQECDASSKADGGED